MTKKVKSFVDKDFLKCIYHTLIYLISITVLWYGEIAVKMFEKNCRNYKTWLQGFVGRCSKSTNKLGELLQILDCLVIY